MKIDFAESLRVAWRMWRADRAVLFPLAGVLIFLPQFAALLLVAEPPALPLNGEAVELERWTDAAEAWFAGGGWALLPLSIVALLGVLTIYVLYLEPARPRLGEALAGAVRRFPRYLALALLVQMAVSAGLYLMIVPGLVVAGRMLVAGPSLVTGAAGIGGAIGQSWRWTRGNTLVLALLAGVTILGAGSCAAILRALGIVFDRAALANPVSLLILDALSATALTIGALAGALVNVAVFRALRQAG